MHVMLDTRVTTLKEKIHLYIAVTVVGAVVFVFVFGTASSTTII